MTTKGFFITGTDTEVGKTLIAGAFILKLQESGIKTLGYKPVAAGVHEVNGTLINDDVETLLKISRRVDPQLTHQNICPFILPEPAAPHLVAQKIGLHLDPKVMLDGFSALLQHSEQVVVEGAGGFLVPINEEYTLGDLAKELDVPVILVVSIQLGCINHTLLTIEAIQKKGLKVVGWVSNLKQKASEFSDENIQTIEKILRLRYGVSLIGQVPYLENLADGNLYSDESLDTVKHHLSLIQKLTDDD